MCRRPILCTLYSAFDFLHVLKKLKIMQKKAIRIVCNANYLDHTGPLFKQQKILPLEKLIKLSALKFMHKYTHGKLPLSFNEIWITNRQRNPNIELRNADNIMYVDGTEPNPGLLRR